jgi:hypothetical protein
VRWNLSFLPKKSRASAFRLGALLVFGAAMFASAMTKPAAAQANFDGQWSVLVVTEAGECDRAYRYALRIDHGVVRYDGEVGIDLTGRVERNGRVLVSISRGAQSAAGTGRLSGAIGTGTWSGKSSTGQCSGTWEAERR